MTIPIGEVLEEAAREADAFNDGFGGENDARYIAANIRALAAKYQDCIVAEGKPEYKGWAGTLYRAKETK